MIALGQAIMCCWLRYPCCIGFGWLVMTCLDMRCQHLMQVQGLWAPDASTPWSSQQWLLGLAASTGCPTALKHKGCQSCPAHLFQHFM